jgi:thiamine kinase-like enzyme
VPPADARWDWPPHPDFRDGPVCHKDPCRENVVFRGGRAYAFIDFDWAGPATPAWDLAGVMSHWVLSLPGDTVGRFRTACAAYGIDPADVVEALLVRTEWGLGLMEERIRAGHAGFAKMWAEGLPAKQRARMDWVRDNAALLTQRLDG